MPFANVYLNGTTRGTLTNGQGHYELSGVPLGTVEVVASFVGYQPQRRTLRLDDSQDKRANFRLKPSDQTLAAVTVRGDLKLWQRHLKQFKQQLLGEPFGGQCQIMNTDAISFKEENGHLRATVSEPLVVENQALGYRLYYDMLYFDGTFQKVYYAGSTRFEELKPADERQASRFRRNRMRAYKGSVRHLMTSLIDSTYEKEGFLVFQEDVSVPLARGASLYCYVAPNDSTRGRLKPLRIRKLIQPGRLPFERRLVSTYGLVVFYIHATSAYSPYFDARYAYSQITLPAGHMQLTVDGVITMPDGMEIQGSLADDRLSTLLPDDWKPNPVDAEPSNTAPILTQGKLLPADARLGANCHYVQRAVQGTGAGAVRAYRQAILRHRRPDMAECLPARCRYQPPAARRNGHPRRPADAHRNARAAPVAARRGWPDGGRLSPVRFAGIGYVSAPGLYRRRRRSAPTRLRAVHCGVQHASGYYVQCTRYGPKTGRCTDSARRWTCGSWDCRRGWVLNWFGPDGRGLSASGRIVNNEGTEISRITTNSRGMGSVVMTPQTGRTYYAEILYNDQHQLVSLPPAESEGFTLSADAVSDSSRLVLTITGTNRPATDSVYVLVQQQGRLVDQRKIQLQNGVARFGLPTASLPPGLNQITLFDDAARPQAERLVFEPERVPPIRVVLSVNKPRYQPREQAIMSITLNDDGLPAVAALSASVTDAEQVPDDSAAATLRTHLLLTGELRGRVEQPNDYLKNNSPTTRLAVDDLLLTQGWRRVSGTPATDQLGGVSLMGRVLNAKNQPVAGAQVIVASTATNQSFVRSAGADERGRFRLAGLAITDTANLLVQLTDRQLKDLPAKDAHLVLDGPGQSWQPDTNRAEPNWDIVRAQLTAARIRQEGDADIYRDKAAKLLKEVIVRARKVEERPDDIRRRSLHDASDATVIFDESAAQLANLYEMIRGRLAGVNVILTQTSQGPSYRVLVRGVSSIIGSTGPLFLLDGTPIQDTDGTALLTFNPSDIERVELLKNAGAAMYGSRGGNGVIAFYSKNSRSAQPKKVENKHAMTPLQLIGYPSVRREFYVPRYDLRADENQPAESARIDRRDVLYWKPLMQTDGQGHSQLLIPLSDVVRTLRVVVQGVTTDGRPVVGETLLRVQ